MWELGHSPLSLQERFLLRDRVGSQPAVSNGAESPSPPLLDNLHQENITIKMTIIQSCLYSPLFSIKFLSLIFKLIVRLIFLRKKSVKYLMYKLQAAY